MAACFIVNLDSNYEPPRYSILYPKSVKVKFSSVQFPLLGLITTPSLHFSSKTLEVAKREREQPCPAATVIHKKKLG